MPRPIEMTNETRDYLTSRIRSYCDSMELSARRISEELNIPEGTTRGWINGRQVPSSLYMDSVLKLLGLHRKACEKCKGFALSEDVDDIVLCTDCQRLHVIRDGKVMRK